VETGAFNANKTNIIFAESKRYAIFDLLIKFHNAKLDKTMQNVIISP